MNKNIEYKLVEGEYKYERSSGSYYSVGGHRIFATYNGINLTFRVVGYIESTIGFDCADFKISFSCNLKFSTQF